MSSSWAAALAEAARRGVPPAAFWRLSVREWRALAAAIAAPPLTRADLERLMRQHPDEPPRQDQAS